MPCAFSVVSALKHFEAFEAYASVLPPSVLMSSALRVFFLLYGALGLTCPVLFNYELISKSPFCGSSDSPVLMEKFVFASGNTLRVS